MNLQKVNVADHIMAEDKAMLVCRMYTLLPHMLKLFALWVKNFYAFVVFR